jgi:hypothetical protein
MIGCGKVGSGTAVKVRQGEARRGKVRFGMARRLVLRLGAAQYDTAVEVWWRLVRFGMVRLDTFSGRKDYDNLFFTLVRSTELFSVAIYKSTVRLRSCHLCGVPRRGKM